MRHDPIDRLRKINPVRHPLGAPPIAPLLDRINTGERGGSFATVRDEQRAPTRRSRVRAALNYAPLAAGIGVALLVAVLALALFTAGKTPTPHPPSSGLISPPGLPTVPQLTPRNRQALGYIRHAMRYVVQHDKSCVSRPRRLLPETPDHGSPSSEMLATFSVLQLKARARLPAPAGFGDAFVRYIRVAQRRYGSAFEVFAVRSLAGGGTAISAKCSRLQREALQRELRHAPAGIRTQALRLGRQQLADERYMQRHPEGICLSGGGGGGCDPFLYAQAQGAIQSSGSGDSGSLFDYLVPNGVATITAHYPAEGPNTGFQHHIPAVTITVKVINNVAIWELAHEPGDLFPTTITWRAADGKTLRIVHPN